MRRATSAVRAWFRPGCSMGRGTPGGAPAIALLLIALYFVRKKALRRSA